MGSGSVDDEFGTNVRFSGNRCIRRGGGASFPPPTVRSGRAGASSRLYVAVLPPGRGAGSRPGENRIDHVAGDAAGEGILLARVKAAEH